MTDLKNIVLNDLKQAMKDKNQVRLTVVRAVKSAIDKFEKENPDASWNDANYVIALKPLIKQRKDSADLYEKAGNSELANNELAEVAIIQSYLDMVQPKQLSEDELRDLTSKLIAEQSLDKTGIGKVMAYFKTNYDGLYDGKVLSSVFKELAN